MNASSGEVEAGAQEPDRSALVRLARIIALFLLGIFLLFSIAFAGLWAFVESDYGRQKITSETNQILQTALGQPVALKIGNIDVGLRNGWRLAVHLRNVALLAPETPVPLASLERLDLVLSPSALVTGRLNLSSLALERGRIEAGLLAPADTVDAFAAIRNEAGQMDPDKATALLMDSARLLNGRTRDLGIRRIELDRVTIARGLMELRVHQASVRRKRGREKGLALEAQADLHTVTNAKGIDVAITSEAVFTPDQRVERLNAEVELPDLDLQPTPRSSADMAGVGIEIEATEKDVRAPGRVTTTLAIDRFNLTPRPHEPVDGAFSLSVRMGEGTGKAEFDDGFLRLGQTHLPLDGAIGPSPLRSKEGTPLYRFELLSNDASIDAVDTALPPLTANFLLRGQYDPVSKIASGDRLAINIAGRKAEGWIALGLTEPLMLGLSLRADYLQTDDLKRLWPYTIAPKTRSFVLEKLTGGSGRDLELDVAAPLPELLDPRLRRSKDELRGSLKMEGVAIALPEELPLVRDTGGSVSVEGSIAKVTIDSGFAEVEGKAVQLQPTRLDVPDTKAKPLRAQLSVAVKGSADALTSIAEKEPIGVTLPIASERLSGEATANVEADLILGPTMGQKPVSAFAVSAQFADAALDGKFQGHTVSKAHGSLFVDPNGFTLRLDGWLDDLAASLDLSKPKEGPIETQVSAKLDRKGLRRFAPTLAEYVDGTVDAEVKVGADGAFDVVLDLKNASIGFAPIGWSKGLGVPGRARFRMETKGEVSRISDLDFETGATRVQGTMLLQGGRLERADLSTLALNETDDARLSLRHDGETMRIIVRGTRLDGRGIIRAMTAPASEKAERQGGGANPLAGRIELDALIGTLGGFGSETLRNAKITFSGSAGEPDHAVLSAVFRSGKRVAFTYERQANRKLQIASGDAGAVLRFADLYDKMSGGQIDALLTGGAEQPMAGKVDIENFMIINEPRLESLASRRTGDRSLNDAVNGKLDTSYVSFDSGSVSLVKSKNRLEVDNGVVRGPQIGMMFEGTVYDANGLMNMTGTFMPAYGLNRIFGEIPILGMVLGNGREQGLIGVTYRLSGSAKAPRLTINPLSVVAPGIFRSIFAFR
ncbi:DUF3971 domain-containing protein [Notoacmeibacter ruber]|uniref:Uncharacterized protein n=1 Tax=Notoacmeibacter ruber TaxID=2670375 RepID=A0A3L7JAV9_9HYPH|nr:DUF3971 domain-containing protein [Notoacmeibacter ruber]RLQ87766.1 hypothetical protein D8780_05640 [Notoacmeibacter ruber]